MAAKKSSKKPPVPQKKMTKEQEKLKKEYTDLSKKFTKKILDKWGSWVKSVVVWGSTARGDFSKKSDIDFVILVDDTRERLDQGLRDQMDDWIYDTAKKLDERIGPQPVWTITEFTRMTKSFTPLCYAVLKDGIPTYDTGFFLTNKRLLEMGEIAATPEAALRRLGDVPKRLARAKNAKMWLIAEDLYYAMIGAEEAVIMYLGRGPPDPKFAADELRKYVVQPGLLDAKYADFLEEVVTFRKAVEHKDIKDIESAKIDDYIKKGEEFVNELERLFKELEIRRKRADIQRTYEVMVKASVAALKAVNKMPEDPRNIPNAFKQHLVDEKKISSFYLDVLDHVLVMKQKMNEKRVEDVPERELALTMEYVRRFVGEVRHMYTTMGLKFEDVKPDSVQAGDADAAKEEAAKSVAKKKVATDDETKRRMATAGGEVKERKKTDELKEHTSR